MKCEAVRAARNATQPFPGDPVQLNGMHRATRVRWFPCTLSAWQPLLALAALSMVFIFFLLRAPVSFRRSDAFGPSSPTAPMAVTAHRKASTITAPRLKLKSPTEGPSAVAQPADDAPRARLLLTDVLFPNANAAWRLIEVKGFMDHFDTDIMVVFRVDTYAGRQITFDWEELKDSFGLHRYDLLILDPEYNAYNKHNPDAPIDGGPPCNGSAFNHALPGRYLLRLRKYAHLPLRVDTATYGWVHHIFFESYRRFTESVPDFPHARQSIHLYPGGGFFPGLVPHEHPPFNIDPRVLLFPTQAFSVDYVRQYLPSNPVVTVYGGPIFPPGSKVVLKREHAPLQPLFACFTSLGDVKEKGADLYVAIAESFRRTHPKDNVVFFGVGAVPPSSAVVHLESMPQASLDAFYREHVDIIFNLERTDRLNGWPLGTEAVAQGAVLFTTDHLNLNERNGYNFGEEVHIVVEANMEATVHRLHLYYGDRPVLHNHSLAGQQRIKEIYGYEAQMPPLLDAIKARIR